MDGQRQPPEGLGPAGLRLWSSVVDEYDLDTHEVVLLTEACRTTDVLVQLDAAVRRDGVLTRTPLNEWRAHPAAVEARQQRITLARILAALRLPQGEDGDHQQGARPQRRAGARGTYGIRGLA